MVEENDVAEYSEYSDLVGLPEFEYVEYNGSFSGTGGGRWCSYRVGDSQ